MKRKLCLLLIFLFLMSITNNTSNAFILENTNAVYMTSGIHTENLNNDPEAQAEMLKKLGLFNGTNKGFELEKEMTRCEAAAMLVRFLGAEEKVLTGTWKHPFNDVPLWADKYVGWLYQSGLTNGVGKDKYGSGQSITYRQFATFLSRACTGDDDFLACGIGRQDELELSELNNLFLRAGAVALSTRTLFCYYTKNGNYMTMAEFLAEKNVFTPEQLGEASWGVLPSDYRYQVESGYLCRTVADVPVAVSQEKNLSIIRESAGADLPYFYAYRVTEDRRIDLFQLDCKAMNTNLTVGYETTTCKSLEYIGSVGGADYFIEGCLKEDGGMKRGSLLCLSSGKLETAVSALELWGASEDYAFDIYIASKDRIALMGTSSLYVIASDSISRYPITPGTHLVYFDGNSIITQFADTIETVISCIEASTGNMLDVYIVPQDMEGYPRTIMVNKFGRIYGEAGLYKIDSQTGRLRQITARPVADVITYRNDWRPIILTHDLGKRIWGMNSFGGDQVILIEDDDTEKVILSNNPDHGLRIAGFTFGNGSVIGFYTAEDQGMQHFNMYYYALNSDGSIVVLDYTAGRPEMEEGFYENPDEYKVKYIKAEQERLNSLGYGLR